MGPAGDGGFAGAVEGSKEGALAHHRQPRLLVVERSKRAGGVGVAVAAGNADGALGHRGQHLLSAAHSDT